MPRRKPVFRLPKQISVLGRVYLVKRIRMEDYGCCDPTTAEIHVRRGLKGDYKSDVVYENFWDEKGFADTRTKKKP